MMGQRMRAVQTGTGATDAHGAAAVVTAPTPTETSAAASRRSRMARLLALGGLRAATAQAATESEPSLRTGEADA